MRWEEKKNHISPKKYNRIVWKLNNSDYRKLSQNKLAEKSILKLLNFPTPNYLGWLNMSSGNTFDDKPLKSVDDLKALLSQFIDKKICFKLLEGWGGEGFIATKVVQDNQTIKLKVLHRINLYGLEEFLREKINYSKGRDYIIEEYFEQHDILKNINYTSLNTIRIWIISRPGHPSTRIVGAFLRVGREGSLVDNTSSGGFFCPINLAMGGIVSSGEEPNDKSIKYKSHPDHGAKIENIKIPFWNQITKLCVEVLDSFPELNFAGVDIAVGENGPVIIEMNVPPDPQGGIQFNFCTKDNVSIHPWHKCH